MAVSLGGQDGVNLGENFGLSPAWPAVQRSLVGAAGRSSGHLASSSKESFVAEIASPEVAPAVVNGGDHGGFLRRFIHLAGPFFVSDEKWMARGLAVGVIGLSLLQIAVQIRLNLWNKSFFDALEAKDWPAFIATMWLFALLASASMGIAVYQVYLKQLLQLRWRRWLTSRLVEGWLENGHHYQVNFIGAGVENPDQRIAENAHFATDMAVEFTLGILNAVLTLVSFLA